MLKVEIFLFSVFIFTPTQVTVLMMFTTNIGCKVIKFCWKWQTMQQKICMCPRLHDLKQLLQVVNGFYRACKAATYKKSLSRLMNCRQHEGIGCVRCKLHRRRSQVRALARA